MSAKVNIKYLAPLHWGAKVFLILLLVTISSIASALTIHGTYKFKRNKERNFRKSTTFIILHTTEGNARGSALKLQKNGEAHYMIDEKGRIYAVVDRRRIAYHCGLSMWNGTTDIDRFSIGIEMVGYHNKDLTAAQITSLAALIKELKKVYPNISDDRIIPHSMVAYGAPNQWHSKKHRGRKRCGMKMATSLLRARLGLKKRPAYDPDVRAKRLIVADKGLAAILFSKSSASEEKKALDLYTANESDNTIRPGRSAWDIARDAYNKETTLYTLPNGTKKRGNEITNWKSLQTGTKVELNTPVQQEVRKITANDSNTVSANRSPWDIAKDDYNKKTTIYTFPNGKQKRGDEITNWKAIPVGTIIDTGDKAKEQSTPDEKADVISKGKSAWDIAGVAYNKATTLYILPSGKKLCGNEITNWNQILPGTKVKLNVPQEETTKK